MWIGCQELCNVRNNVPFASSFPLVLFPPCGIPRPTPSDWASSRPHLATTPLPFSYPSVPSQGKLTPGPRTSTPEVVRQGRRDQHWRKVVVLRWDATHPSNPGGTCSGSVRPDESGVIRGRRRRDSLKLTGHQASISLVLVSAPPALMATFTASSIGSLKGTSIRSRPFS